MIARAFVLAEGYAALLAVERRVCKGQTQTVTSVAPFDCVIDEGCQLDRLIDLLDSRCEREADPLSQYGT